MIWLRLKKFDRQEMYFNNLSLMCHSAESVLTWCMDYWDRGRLRYMWSVVYSCGKWWMCVVKVYELCTCTYVRVSRLIRHFLYQFLFLYIDSVISSDSGLSNSLECNHKLKVCGQIVCYKYQPWDLYLIYSYLLWDIFWRYDDLSLYLLCKWI